MIKNILSRYLFPILLTICLISLLQGIYNAQLYSQDLQWSGAKLFAAGKNPYSIYLDGNASGEIILSQVPNYLHLLYILLIPLGLVEFQIAKFLWVISNLIFTFAIFLILRRKISGVTPKKILVIAAIFIASTPFRNCIGTGQISILILLGFLIALFSNSVLARGFFAALSVCKYSFAPPLALHLLFERKYFEIFIIATLHGLAILLFQTLFDMSYLETAMLPLRVSSTGVGLGLGDVMSLMEIFGHKMDYLTYAIPLILCVITYLAYHATTKRENLADMAFICILSLISFKHLGYDFVFLLPALVWSMKVDWKKNFSLILVISWFWFGLKLLNSLVSAEYMRYFVTPLNLLMLYLAAFLIWNGNRKVMVAGRV